MEMLHKKRDTRRVYIMQSPQIFVLNIVQQVVILKIMVIMMMCGDWKIKEPRGDGYEIIPPLDRQWKQFAFWLLTQLKTSPRAVSLHKLLLIFELWGPFWSSGPKGISWTRMHTQSPTPRIRHNEKLIVFTDIENKRCKRSCWRFSGSAAVTQF